AATPVFTNTLTLSGTTVSELVTEFAVHRDGTGVTFYAATGNSNGQVYVSNDGGATWTLQVDNNFCGGQCFYDVAVAVDPSNPLNVYLGGDPTLIIGKSVNGGATFSETGLGVHVDTHAIAVSESNPLVVYLGTDGGIYKSTNAGGTWMSLNNTTFSATQFMSLDVHPTDGNFSIGGTQDNGTNFYRPDGTWIRADFGDGGFAVIDQNAPDVTNVRMYHTYFNAVSLQGYGTVSNTGSASDGNWTFRGCQSSGFTVNGITCDGAINFYAPLERGPGNPNTIYYGSDRLYRSANEGVSHTVVSQNPISSGVPISSIGISPQNDDVRIVGLNNGELHGTSTGSSTLTNLDTGNVVPDVAVNRSIVDPNDPDVAYVTLSAFDVDTIWKTSDLSSVNPVWTAIMGAGLNSVPQIPVNAIVVDPLDSNHVYVGTDIGVYFSSDAGASWIPYGVDLPRVAVFDMAITATRMVKIATHGRGFWEIPASPVNPPICDAGGPYSGITDIPVQFDGSGSSDPGGTIVSYDWDFGDGGMGTGVMPTHTYGSIGTYVVTLCVTDNDGQQSCCQTPATIESPIPVAMASMDIEASGGGVTLTWSTAGSFATGFHILRSTGPTETAVRLTQTALAADDGPGSYQYVDRTAQPGRTYFYHVEALSEDGSQRFAFPAVKVDRTTGPLVTLHANHPNPFNPSTTISFDLGVTAYTVLRVYDVRGAEVRQLVARELPAGPHAVEWDGRDSSGSAVVSGVYRYRIDAAGQHGVGTMVLLK
ncbi:MAG: PKD domain-containing protein, partial [Gemmatimonadetes bacterium]|nr:PKD domain-containing protein [Gemmatimonadota bacterium]